MLVILGAGPADCRDRILYRQPHPFVQLLAGHWAEA
jgi:hypothetical protein